jgi:hypothetical protein
MNAMFVTKVIITINPRANGWHWWGKKAAVKHVPHTTDV